jgi:hypothetical protein
MAKRQKIVRPYYKYKQEAFSNLVRAVEGVASRVWGNGKPLNFSPSDFVFEINYTLGSFKRILISQGGGSLGEITYEDGVFFNYYGRVGNSARVEKKRIELTSQEFKELRDATINLGKLTEDEPVDFLINYVVKVSEKEILRYNPFPGGGGGNSRVYWIKE